MLTLHNTYYQTGGCPDDASAFFADWYQATVPAHHELVIRRLLAHLPEGVRRLTCNGVNNYKLGEALLSDQDECLATVYHGGFNPHPNVKASGGDCGRHHGHELARMLKLEFPDHRVTRLDVALDGRGDGLYERAASAMHSVWVDQRAKGRRIKDDRRGGSAPEDGRTYYLGSPASPLRARLYEKGKERLAVTGDPYWLDYLDVVRLELQVRPVKAAGKSAAAFMDIAAFWGGAEWTRQVAQGVLAMSAEPIQLKAPRLTDHERAMRHVISQYGPTFLRHIDLMGSPEAFCDDLLRRLGVTGEEASRAA